MKKAMRYRRELSVLVIILAAGAVHSTAQSQAPGKKPGSFRSSAILIRQFQSEGVKLPAEFQMALYEDTIEEVGKTKRFQHVYRDGEKTPADASDLVTLRCTVTGFSQGSEMARQVTTVLGATKITVHMEFSGPDGKVLLETDEKGYVRFFGTNLRATYDFGKKVGAVVRRDFAASRVSG